MVDSVPTRDHTGSCLTIDDYAASTAEAWGHALRLFVQCEDLKARIRELERRLAVSGG
jgi:hypothetical protein